jgi:Mrp family chromosome partitioning ATPase
MLGRRPPVLARIPNLESGRLRPGALDRASFEAFAVLLEELDGDRVVLVTGEEERSTAALGLAAAAVTAGRRVALVEGELARPALAASLGLAPAPGLGEYLRGQVEAPQLLQPVVAAGPAAGEAAPLVCIVAGSAREEAAALLASEGFGEALARLRSGYDLVVLDGPGSGEDDAVRVAALRADRTLCTDPRSEIPKSLRGVIDGLVVRV